MRYSVLVLACVSTAASSQTTTTNCTRDWFGNTNCTSQTQPAIPQVQPLDYGALIRSMPKYTYQGPSIAEGLREDREKKAAKMIAKGDCAGAEQYALKKGDLSLARAVRGYCAAR